MNKSLSLLRLGNPWFSRLVASVIEAGRTISYIETVNPSQADTMHKAIKWSEQRILQREYEKMLRTILKCLRLGKVKVAVDVTEEPYWGKQGVHNTRARVHEKSDESWQYVNLAVVEPHFIPLMSLPYRQIDNLDTLAMDLLSYLRTLPLRVTLVLFDRGFYHAELIDYLENRRGGTAWPYLILAPKNKAVVRYLAATTTNVAVYRHRLCYKKAKSKWRPQTNIVICKGVGKDKNGKPLDWCFATNQRGTIQLVWQYRKRWNIETGFRIQDEAKIKSKSAHPLIRYFYHLVSMLLILMWRIQNHVEGHMVFKRFLKCIELCFTKIAERPPLWASVS